ncbi:MAG: 50S ribosomal protein L4 [Candidatus Firestonebacteria bacterium]
MAKFNVYDMAGKEVEQLELSDAVFGIEPNKAVMTEAVLNELANVRRGTAKAKTRGEVSGGGRKPWKQKGTGRARQGSIRAVQWRKGGIAHGPKVRDYSYKLPDKVKKLAYKSILSSKAKENLITIVSDIKVETPKTKTIIAMLKALKSNVTKTLIIVNAQDAVVKKSVANLAKAKMIYVNNINCHDLMNYENLVFTKDAIIALDKRF